MWEMLSRSRPYPAKSNVEVLTYVVDDHGIPSYPKGTTDAIWELMKGCW